MARIAFEHIDKRYSGDALAVNDLNLEINDGEFLVLVGPSGCGKTTALRCLAGLEEISDGQIVIGDRVVNDLPPKDRDIAMVFQSYALYPHMTRVREHGLRHPDAQAPQGGDRRQGARGRRRSSGSRTCSTASPGSSQRRSAPARGAGPRHRARPRRLPDGRAAQQPRRQAARADARRDRAPAPAPRHHDRLRHPRPGRGDDDGRPHRGDARRGAAAGGHAEELYERARQPLRRRLHRLARR